MEREEPVTLIILIFGLIEDSSANMEKDKLIKDAQYRKGLSIAFFNATNAAIEMAKLNGMAGVLDPKKFITEWRDWLLEEHRTYYATVISNVGTNYNPEDTVKKLRSAKGIEELKTAWQLLSEDERRNPEISKLTKELKASFLKPKKDEKA